jgi:hypothetical protein
MSQEQHKPREIHKMYGWVVIGKRDGVEHALHFPTKEEAMKSSLEGILMDERYYKEVYLPNK